MTAINPQRIDGAWLAGVALDFHTTSSTPVGENEFGHMRFETVRPEIAELLYRLKYKGDQTGVAGIVAGAVDFLAPHGNMFDLIVPVPPSNYRAIQPVMLLASGIGQALGKTVASCVMTTRGTSEIKGVTDPEQRQKLVSGLYAVDTGLTKGRNILLFDDLYRSGTTMNAITNLLLGQGSASSVRVLTITKTRSTR